MKVLAIEEMLKKHYDIDCNIVKSLRTGGSKTFIVECTEIKYILKVVPSSFRATVVQSLEILKYLEKYDYPSPRVVETIEGHTYMVIKYSSDEQIIALYEYIEGYEIDDSVDFEIMGGLVGRLHSIMKNCPVRIEKRDKEFFIDRYIDILKEKNYNSEKISQFRDYGDYLWSRVNKLPLGYCHGDLHRGNIIKDSSNKYYLLDFDTSCNAFAMYDIMMLCNMTDYFEFKEEGYEKSKKTFESFLKGYYRHCKLSDYEIDLFFDLIAVYHYQLQATIIEIYGLDCVDESFLDNQLDWLMKWKKQCENFAPSTV